MFQLFVYTLSAGLIKLNSSIPRCRVPSFGAKIQIRIGIQLFYYNLVGLSAVCLHFHFLSAGLLKVNSRGTRGRLRMHNSSSVYICTHDNTKRCLK